MRTTKAIISILAFAILIVLIIVGGIAGWFISSYRLPPEQRVRDTFEEHRADYIQLVELIGNHPLERYIDGDGGIETGGNTRRVVPEYQRLIRKTGAKFAVVGEDGSVEFALFGNGCAICSDSYMGILFLPNGQEAVGKDGWMTAVTSLASKRLPQENGSVATGLYVVKIEAKWFVYRFEYQE